jgi:hypothetical protein
VNGNDSAYLMALVHDLQIFIDLWQREASKQFRVCEALMKQYGAVSHEYDDDFRWCFSIDGVKFIWDYGKEEMFLEGDFNEEPINSGKAYDFAMAHNKAVQDTYSAVEREMDLRGWFHDPDEYEYFLAKDGWTCQLGYYPTTMESARNFVYEPDEPGYYYYVSPSPRPAVNFKLSDLEAAL